MKALTKSRLKANLLFRRKSKRDKTKAKLRSLQEGGLEFEPEVRRVQKCSQQYPCNSKWCPDCAVPKPIQKKAVTNDRDDHPQWYEAVALDTKSGSPRSRSGKAFLQFYQAFSDRNVVTAHIHLNMTPFDPMENQLLGDQMLRKSEIAIKKLKKDLLEFNPDISVKGKIETIPKKIDKRSRELLADKSWLDSIGDHSLAMNEHVHFLLTLDDFSMDELSKFLKKKGYFGKKQVCIKPITWTGKSAGLFSYGPTGLGEYVGNKTYSGFFPREDIEVAQAVARMDKAFNARKKNFRINATNLPAPVCRKECLPPPDAHESYLEYLEQEKYRSYQFNSEWEQEMWMTHGQCELHPDDRISEFEYDEVNNEDDKPFSFFSFLDSFMNHTLMNRKVHNILYYNWSSLVSRFFNGLRKKFSNFRRGNLINWVTRIGDISFHKRE